MATPAASAKTCSRCGVEQPLDAFQPNPNGRYGRKSTCRKCNRISVKAWMAANPDKRLAQQRRSWDRHKDEINEARRMPGARAQENARRRDAYREDPARFQRDEPEKKYARRRVWAAVKTGALVRGDCSACGSPNNVQAHHENYDRPLDVTWLCARCHTALHREAVV